MMLKNKARLRTTEGKDFKVWLEYPEGKRIRVRRDTANVLFLKGYITLDEKSGKSFFEYKYTGKKVS